MIILTVGCCLVTKTAVTMVAVLLLLLSVSCVDANAEVVVPAVQDSTQIGGLL
jgi:hypothetical protein